MVNTKDNLEKQAQDWRENWIITVPADSQKSLPIKRGQKFKLKLEDKLQINLRHSVYYTLL